MSALAALSTASPAGAATECGKKVLADWFDNGRIDRLYPLNCYEEAIDAIPDDLRDYADAEDVITRALQAALRGELAPGGARSRPRTTTIPTNPGSNGGDGSDDGSGGTGNSGGNPQAAPGVDTSGPSSVPIPCSCWAECRSHCSRPAGSDTSRVGGTAANAGDPDDLDPLA